MCEQGCSVRVGGGREWVVKGASSGTTAEKLFSYQLSCVFIIAQNIGTVECQFLC